MPTIIDALIVTLGLDPKAFKKGAKGVDDTLAKTGKNAKKPGQALEQVGKKDADAMDKFRKEIIRTTAAIVGLAAIKAFVSSVTQSDAALGRMSTNVGMSTQALSQWEGAASIAGGSAEGMAGDIKGLVQQVQRFSLTGEGGESLKYFRAIGVNVTDAGGRMRDMGKILLDVSDKLKGMDPAKAQAIGAGLGLSEGTINLLMQGRGAVQGYLDAYAKANTRTPEDARNAMERQKSYALLLATFNRLATDILNKVTPALVGLMDFIRNHAGVAATLIGSIGLALASMSAIRFVALISQLGTLTTALRGVSAAATAAAGAEAVGTAGAAGAAGGLAGARGALGRMGAVGRFGIYAAAAAGAYEIFNLGSSLKDWWDIKHREGIKLSDPNGMARLKASEGAGAGADKGAYLKSLEKQFGLPAGLLDAVWLQESSRGANKRSSRAGAKGDFQFVDKTARAYGVVDSNDFGQSAMGAARMYRDLIAQYKGNIPMALAAYNEGSGNLANRGMGNLPLETQGYIRNIMATMRGGGAGNSSTTEVHIGTLAVSTQANDAKGIAATVPQALRNQSYALQSNTGLM